MSTQDFIVSLDIGTSKVRALVAEIHPHTLHIVGVGQSVSEGMKKGSIVDIDATVKAIKEAVSEAERMIGIEIHDVFVGLTGSHIQLQPAQGVVAVSGEDREIRQQDVDRVVDAAKVMNIPPERVIVDVVPKEFSVDGLSGIHDPRGMIGVRLEMEGTLITCAKTPLHNLIRCIERADLEMVGLLLQPMAAAELVLSKDERNVGCALIDMGAGTTTITIYQQGDLVAHSLLPFGGDYITSDIATGLYTTTEMAEKIKIKYGCALIEQSSDQEFFNVPRIASDVEKQFSQYDLANIIEPRLSEMLYLTRKEIERLGYPKLPGGYVFTGGVSAMPGFLTLAKEFFDQSARIAYPDFIGVRDPSYTAGVGLLQYAQRYVTRRTTSPSKETSHHPASPAKKKKKIGSQTGVLEKVRSWFSEFI
ncbi:cell division protein FtsA [Thermicanus aegyptius]|uniref:cell division protein FtsA n=1 Tax=Thermicanus aegyptius TaxID=94009 RepID=UPI000421BDFB|nr:cell division protein FtsA [Thermicanus aegyptius]